MDHYRVEGARLVSVELDDGDNAGPAAALVTRHLRPGQQGNLATVKYISLSTEKCIHLPDNRTALQHNSTYIYLKTGNQVFFKIIFPCLYPRNHFLMKSGQKDRGEIYPCKRCDLKLTARVINLTGPKTRPELRGGFWV